MWFLRSKVFGGSGDQERDRDDEDAPRRIMDALSYRRPRADSSMMGARQSTTSHHDTFQGEFFFQNYSSI
ncbi:hypothetical protein L5515_014918 [Caenorhabditis briggsae]|uniref:Uncharacterized protein n=1 Tax=Caenorhabditis briggsae TaxID=6238 RepID=A0AAE9EAE9_CAEBR|nr:hypothetical protein L5515_014918 [Caenorhabditis briggsae]